MGSSHFSDLFCQHAMVTVSSILGGQQARFVLVLGRLQANRTCAITRPYHSMARSCSALNDVIAFQGRSFVRFQQQQRGIALEWGGSGSHLLCLLDSWPSLLGGHSLNLSLKRVIASSLRHKTSCLATLNLLSPLPCILPNRELITKCSAEASLQGLFLISCESKEFPLGP